MADLGAVGQQGLLTENSSDVGQASPWDNNGAQSGLLTFRTDLYLDLPWDNNGAEQGLLTKRSFFDNIPAPPDEPPSFPQADSVNPNACRAIKECLPCNDEPISNLSSEEPDVPLFCQTVTFTDTPRLGECPQEISCTQIACSTESNIDAYLEALRLAQECVWGATGAGSCVPPTTNPCDPFCPPPPCPPCVPDCPPNCPPPPPTVSFAYNTAQSCSAACPDGGTFTWTVAAGKVAARTLAEANSKARALACKLAKIYKICIQIIGSTTSCRDDYMSFVARFTGPISQSPFPSQWTVEGPGIDPNVLTYDLNGVSGTQQIRIFGTPTIAIETTITVRITDLNTGFFMEREVPIIINACTVDWGNVTPDINSGTRSYWNLAQDIPAGNYRIAYVNGAVRYNASGEWWLNHDNNSPFGGYRIAYNNDAATAVFPGTASSTDGTHFFSQAEVEAANAGRSITFAHTGGRIGVYLSDQPYADNLPGSPNPTFKLETL